MKRISICIGIPILMTAIIMTGCTKNQASENSSSENSSSANTSTGEKKQESRPRTEMIVIPTGTNIVASLETPLSTDTNQAGDQFHARTTEAIVIEGKTVIPAGSQIHGVLADVQDSGKIKDRARMTLTYQGIVDAAGKTHSISAEPLTLQASSKTKGDVEKIAAGGILGAIIGGIAGGSRDAVIGAGAGAAAGTILVLATKGEDITLDPGQRLNIHMLSPTSIALVAQK